MVDPLLEGEFMKYLRTFCAWLILLALSTSSLSQTYQGRILGTVTDENGAVVKSAKIVITNVETGVSRALETNDAGDYVAPNLPPGVYTIVAEATGFKRIERTGVRLEVAKDVRIDLVLNPGALSESITVSNEAPIIDSTSTTLGG